MLVKWLIYIHIYIQLVWILAPQLARARRRRR